MKMKPPSRDHPKATRCPCPCLSHRPRAGDFMSLSSGKFPLLTDKENTINLHLEKDHKDRCQLTQSGQALLHVYLENSPCRMMRPNNSISHLYSDSKSTCCFSLPYLSPTITLWDRQGKHMYSYCHFPDEKKAQGDHMT